MLTETIEMLDAESGRIEMSFPYFVTKAAPVSRVESLMDYEVTFIGESGGNHAEPQIELEVLVPVTTLCPCSKNIF